jgi:hypothetical protein
MPTFENAITFEPSEISTSEWHHFAQDRSVFNSAHMIFALSRFPIHKMVGSLKIINAITSEPFNRFMPHWRHFVQ